MTGLEVLRACERYAGDMRRLQVALDIAKDAATRITPAYGAQAGGRGGDRMSAPERFALRAEGLTRRMDARRAMYALELAEAARLLETMEPLTARMLYLRMIGGLTVKQVSTETDVGLDSVRGILARGRAQLSGMDSGLDRDMTWREMHERYAEK